MTNNEMNEVLANIISVYAPTFGRSLTKKVALRLATSSIEQAVQNITGDTYVQARTALYNCGTILEEDETNKTLCGVILAGAANLNPCFVVLWIECDMIHIKANAKEGLIKQHTVEQAIKIFQSTLDALDSGLLSD